MSDPQEPGEGERRTPPKVPRPAAAPLTVSPAVLQLRDELGMCDTHAARELALEHFWTEHPRLPILEVADPGKAFAEGRYTVTFLWQDAEAEEVLLFASGITDELDLSASLMRRVPDTDLWHLSYRMRGDWRASYGFTRRLPGEAWPWTVGDQLAIRFGLDRGLADPRNPRSCRNRVGTVMSVVALPDAPAQPWLERREGLGGRGRVTELLGPDERTVWVYEPPSAPAGSASPLPAVVLLDGEVWTGTQDIATTVDNLLADGAMRPCLIVMPASYPDASPEVAPEAAPEVDARGSDWIVHRLLPWVRAHYSVSGDAADTIVAGQGLGGYTALRAALEFPDAVGAVLSQSASLWQRRLPAPDPAQIHRLHAYIEVGSQEWVLREPNERLASEFTRFGADTHFVEYNGGHDYACWRGGIAEGLRTLLGPSATVISGPNPASAR